MPHRSHQLVTGEYYHIYNRGNSKKQIFHDSYDYEYFLTLLNLMNTTERRKTVFIKSYNDPKKEKELIVSIGAYVLMPNHFHILIKQEHEEGITSFVQKLLTAYVMHYNKKYKHTGSLFEGRFKSKYVGEDRYLKYLFAYIHLNCLKILDSEWKKKATISTKEKINFLINYKWSSFNEYYKDKEIVINRKAFPKYFPSSKDFMKEIFSWIIFDDF